MFSFLSRVVQFIAIGIETGASRVQLGKTGRSRDGR